LWKPFGCRKVAALFTAIPAKAGIQPRYQWLAATKAVAKALERRGSTMGQNAFRQGGLPCAYPAGAGITKA
jgi:hypothetical protein